MLIENSDIDINMYADILLPPIINKWNLLDDLDEGLLSILECLYYLISVCNDDNNNNNNNNDDDDDDDDVLCL